MRTICAFLLLLTCFQPVVADDRQKDLAGSYKVKGECFERTESSSYQKCELWNTLELKRKGSRSYDYTLSTNTFATTQGGCESSGTLELQQGNKRTFLHGNDQKDARCHVVFEVDPIYIWLVEPTSNENGCQSLCALNSSLYSDPFPRQATDRSRLESKPNTSNGERNHLSKNSAINDQTSSSDTITVKTQTYPRPPYSGATYYIYEQSGAVICTKLAVCNKYDECRSSYFNGSHKDQEDQELGEPYGVSPRVAIPSTKLGSHVCLVGFGLINQAESK